MKRNNLFAILIVFFCLFVGAFILFNLSKPIQQNVVEAQVIVDEGIGFNLQTDKLYFGRAMPGTSSKRGINISSPNDALLVISTKGEIASWMFLQRNIFLLEASVPLDIPFKIFVPENASLGNYSANVTFTIYRPFMKLFLPVATEGEKNKTFK